MGETARPASVAIHSYSNFLDVFYAAENSIEVGIGCIVGDVADVYGVVGLSVRAGTRPLTRNSPLGDRKPATVPKRAITIGNGVFYGLLVLVIHKCSAR